MAGLATIAGAAEVLSARVDRDEGRYHIEFAVIIDGEPDRLQRIVTDYANLDRLSPTVVSSRLLSGRAGEDAKVEVILRPCVLVFFCKTITKVSDAHVEPDTGRVRYVAVPGLSDFQEGRETITMTPEKSDGAARVRFSYSAVLMPDFYVPRFAGAWLIRRAIVNDLETASRRVERMLQQESR